MHHFRSSSTIAAALGIAAVAAPVHAQEALEEIIVTALKRAESLQDAPATVTAFDAETIEQARIQSMRDYVNLTSNMTLMETQNNAFAFVNIRGLAQIRNVDPTVAVVVDGVLSTTSLAFSQELYDIQQIEVLKGPQGALYGRNATGGAINITTKQPTTDPEFYVRGGVGNGDSVQFSDLRFGITAARGWEAVVWIDNATDEDWISEESNPNGIVYYGKPQQYGVEMTYRF